MRSVVIKAGRPSGTRGVRLRRRLRLRPFGRFRLSGTGAASPPVSQQPAAASPAGETEPTPTAEPSLAVPTPSPSPAATPSPTASPSPTVVPIPEKPTGVTFKVVRQVPTNDGYRETHRVTWMTPRSAGIEMRVWGVTACLSEPKHPKPGAAGPCLVPHTALPASVLEPITKAPASAGKVTWTWGTLDYCDTGDYLWKADPSPGGEMYFAVVMATYTASNHSVFAIPFPGVVLAGSRGDGVLTSRPRECFRS